MKCLCCDKEINNPTENERISKWHTKCIKKFFGISVLPELYITDSELEKFANTTVSKGLTVPGVQKKLSLHLGSENKVNKLTIVDYPTGYILKPQSEEYAALPEAEFLVMKMAEKVGIKTVPCALMQLGDNYAYITKRADRVNAGKSTDSTKMLLAMEDFCQLSGRLTSDKYKSSYEQCGKVISRYSKNVGLDMAELYYRLLFCFVTGNSDMHLKNFSLIEDKPGSRKFGLSPAYDLLPVNVILPADKDQTALSLNGKKRNIRKKDFLELAINFGITDKTATRLMDKITKNKDELVLMTGESYLPDDYKKALTELIEKRCEILC
ncbi:HipA domain-containing protein [Butyrivibrio sp. AD3002]|uniref:HipA domain-containing protein n=1 Tax=Butyrivibrio sp. AD3002 TaxID=1280670 RepID=UPI0003B36137|nr:HipA domain-containing protein [Butyrivibrio sp. AD3002]